MQDGDTNIQYVPTDQQLGDFLSKTLGEERYSYLRNDVGILPKPLEITKGESDMLFAVYI